MSICILRKPTDQEIVKGFWEVFEIIKHPENGKDILILKDKFQTTATVNVSANTSIPVEKATECAAVMTAFIPRTMFLGTDVIENNEPKNHFEKFNKFIEALETLENTLKEALGDV